MSEKIVKIRKPRTCDYCEKELPVGTRMKLVSTRSPVYDTTGADFYNDFDEGKQVGIFYNKSYLCVDHAEEDHAKVAGVTIEVWREWVAAGMLYEEKRH